MASHAKGKRINPTPLDPPELPDIPRNLNGVCRSSSCDIEYLHAPHPMGPRRGPKPKTTYRSSGTRRGPKPKTKPRKRS